MLHQTSLTFTVFLLAGISNAAAQSAEETVAFMTDGMEDGREVHSAGAYLITQEAGKPVFVISAVYPPSEAATVTVERINACKYSVIYDGHPYRDGEYIYDFSYLVDAKNTDKMAWLRFSGSCPITFGGQCLKSQKAPLGFEVEPHRLGKAIAYFKENFCKGRAF